MIFNAYMDCCLRKFTMQAQYVFVYDSLSELVMCGETEVAAANFRINMIKLQKLLAGDPSRLTGFQKQFEVRIHNLASASYCTIYIATGRNSITLTVMCPQAQ